MLFDRLAMTLLFATLAFAGPPARGATIAADVGEGEELAHRWCANCHVVADDQRTPAVAGVPPFKTLANDPSVTDFRLRMFLITPHPVMPNFMLTREQTDNLIAYIQSLKDKK